MTTERKSTLTSFLNSDQERAEKLLALSADEALAQINALGYNYTADELREYARMLKSGSGGELDIEALDAVAGGGSVSLLWGLIKISW